MLKENEKEKNPTMFRSDLAFFKKIMTYFPS